MSPFARCLKIMKLENTQKGKEENEKGKHRCEHVKNKKSKQNRIAKKRMRRNKWNEEKKDLLPEFWHGF